MKRLSIQARREKSESARQGADEICCGKCERAALGTCSKLDGMLAALEISIEGGRVEVQL